MEWDELAFFFIHNLDFPEWLEHLFVLARNKYFWFPLYVFLVASLIVRYKKRSWIGMLAIACCILLCDGVSSKLIKPQVERLRPCKAYPERVDVRVHCGSGYSFPSSHATNHFGLSVLLIFLFDPLKKSYVIALLFWAVLVSFSQIYVGVHYPVDVILGGFLGMLIGYGLARLAFVLHKRIYV